MRQYIALIHRDAGSHFGVSFPDLPGCATAGTTLDEARTFAEEALTLHLAGLVEDGELAPEPSTLESIMTDRSNMDAVAVLVAAKTVSAKTIRVNITMPEDMLAHIDAHAERRGMNRSGFLAYAARQEIAKVDKKGGS